MKIISWNVNGIRAIHKKRGFIDFLTSMDADIVCVQETKVHSKDVLPAQLIRLKRYHSYFSFNQIKKGVHGVAVYSKQQAINVETKLGIESIDNEGRILILHFADMILFNVYCPATIDYERLNYKVKFMKAFISKVNQSIGSGKSILVCGDFNVAHTDLDSDYLGEGPGRYPPERKLLGEFIDSGFTDAFRYLNPHEKQFSWWPSDVINIEPDEDGLRLDYIFINDKNIHLLKKVYYRSDISLSDHCPVIIELNKATV